MMPVPSLPVLSAISCSTQRPKLLMDGEATMVSLSRPLTARAPMTAPSMAPGLSRRGALEAQASRMESARSKMASRSSPIRAAGTRPKYESTENRPPMSDGFRNARRNLCTRASSSSELPWSVMATKLLPACSSASDCSTTLLKCL